LKQFPLTNRQENFKRHQLLEELIETNMFTMEVGKKWQEDIDLLALHKMKNKYK